MNTEKNKTPLLLRLVRHLAALFLISFLNPFTLNNIDPFISAFYIFAGTTIWSAILFGLYFLFFTEKAKKSWPRGFIATAWLFITLVMIGYWKPGYYLNKYINNKQASSTEHSSNSNEVFQEKFILARQGNAEAQYYIGRAYDGGEIVLRDYNEAMYWYRLAANQGHIMSQRNIGLLYLFGKGVEMDTQQAILHMLPAAENGDKTAQLNLGVTYLDGGISKSNNRIPKNHPKAMYWFQLAAQQNSDIAQYYIGIMYEEGYGVTKSQIDAEYWYKLSADQNFRLAKEALARIKQEQQTR